MCQMSPCELVSFVTALACTISKNCEDEEVELLAVVFTQLGDTLTTIGVKQSLCQKEAK